MIVRCIDFECSGLAPPEAAVIEIGWTDLNDETGSWDVGATHSTFVNPGHLIPAETSAVHHIVDGDVASSPTFSEASIPLLSGAPVALCAHFAKYEKQFFPADGVPWICSYKVALHLAPNAPAHNLQTLRYWLNLAVHKETAAPPHRAGPDSYVGAHLLARMLPKLTVEQMIEISSRPALLSKFHFGKHKDCPLAKVPSDYLDWIVRQNDMDEDVIHTARHHLKLRSEAA